MMKKFLKIATICSLAFSLSTANLVYATEPDPGDPGSGSDDPITTDTEVFTDTSQERNYDILAKFEIVGKQRYAIDIFHSSNLTFHYQISSSFDTNHFTTSSSTTNVSLPQGSEDTLANAVAEGVDGVWFGFNGVRNRISVFNRSNADVKMTVTSERANTQLDSTNVDANINLYLNGDGIEDYAQRKLNVTTSKEVALDRENGDEYCQYQDHELLYDTLASAAASDSTTSPIYTSNMTELLKVRQAFSTVANDTSGGRFGANPETSGQTVEPVTQSGGSANNFVNIVRHSVSEGDHYVGYALVYFDISGKPFEVGAPYSGMKLYGDSSNNTVAPQIGSITLTFTATE